MSGHIKQFKYGLRFLPDKLFLQIYYFAKFKKLCNFKNPKTFSEKLQWIKLYDHNPKYTNMVDKFEAKKYVSKIIGREYIIPTLGVYDSFDNIDFDKLPNQFVLKCTHDSGGLVICRDKKLFSISEAREKINASLNFNYYYISREWPYKNVKPRIIVEKYMENSKLGGLIDYKFYCFNGQPQFLYISSGMENHKTARISFITLDWKKAPYERVDYKTFEELPSKPTKLDEMIKISEKLSEGIPFIRVDLYQIGDQVYFSELTLFPCGGLMIFKNSKYDYELGEKLKL